MNTTTNKPVSSERETSAINGWPMLLLNLAAFLGLIAAAILVIVEASRHDRETFALWLIPIAIAELATFISFFGHFTLQPNEARVLILFGEYKGTVRQSGFWWANPFYSRTRGPSSGPMVTVANAKGGTETTQKNPGPSAKISLRARNFNSERLKVNDKRGNPIEIAAVIVWRVEDTAKAAFDVDDFESYVHIQSESAIRHIASLYAYDRGDEHEPTLRESADEVAAGLKTELLERLQKAGVVIEEARLTHLAYAPEIAQAMLRRQQAEAVIAARQKIVHGAVSMVDMALRELAEKSVVKLDDERKAAMVSNLLVVLCGETEASPVINTGTLYS
jgi:regulator of protease activity HflC (stomatin/prohibitin superfamily)